jgi:hypothetical protein
MAQSKQQDKPLISVTEISTKIITGIVRNVERYSDYKVIVYASKVDGMLIKQAYPGCGEGQSWARVDNEGKWALSLVERFSKKMNFINGYVVFLVRMDLDCKSIPDQITTFNEIEYVAKEEIFYNSPLD